MINWSDEAIPEKMQFDDVIRHGSIVRVTEEELDRMMRLVKKQD